MHRSALWLPPTIASFKSQTMTSGIVETTEELPVAVGFQRINTLSVNLSNANVRLGVVQEHNRLFGSGETLSSMAARTDAVAGINGDFFEIGGSGDELGMLETRGQIWQSPASFAVLGVTPSGRITIGPESFSGAVTADDTSYPLHAVNRSGDAGKNRLALFTPALGTPLQFNAATVALLDPVAGSSTSFTVESVQSGVTSLPALLNQEALVGGDDAGDWLSASLSPGASITITEQITPDSNLVQAIGGGPMLIKDGVPYQDPSTPAPDEASARNPLTAIGITRDGTEALLVVCDGHQADPGMSKGFTRAEMTEYLLAHGAYQAMLFDGGGSSEMVARLPGQSQVSVINSPSDGHERPVANGLFLYSTERHPGPATSVVLNHGNPLTVLASTDVPVSAYALDALDNPAPSAIRVSVLPRNLASFTSGTVTGGLKAGQGQLLAQVGQVRDVEPLQVIDHLASLHLTPPTPDLANGQHLQFQLTGTAPGGAPVFLPAGAVHWSINPPSLGSISPTGLFTASASALEVGSVTATGGGTSASVSVAVGQITQPLNSLTDLRLWGVSEHYISTFPGNVPNPGPQVVSTGSISLNTDMKRLPTDDGSMDLHYHFPQGQHVYHLDPYPNDPRTLQIPLRAGRQLPDALGIWARNDPSTGSPGEHGALLLSIDLSENATTPLVFQLGVIPCGRWTFFRVPLPQGLISPLRLQAIAVVRINPTRDENGNVYLSDLQALYAPRPLQ